MSPYSYWWHFRRWRRRRKIKIDYPNFWQAVVRKKAW